MKDFAHYNLLPHNTFGISAVASRFVEYDSVEELRSFLKSADPANKPILHIGSGSNLLFTGDFFGTVLHSAIRTIETIAEDDDNFLLRIGSGVIWDEFVSYTVDHNLYGAENLSLIPGEVGATAVQNIGAYGAEAKDIIDTVETVDLATAESRSFSNHECRYAYRDSIFKNELRGKYAVTHVVYKLSKTPCFRLDYGNIRSELQTKGLEVNQRNLRETITEIRKAKLPDPKETGNAGSFFMNPVIPQEQFKRLAEKFPSIPHYPAGDGLVKLPAGWLIDQCGWKGQSLGKAGVHDKQALVLVNRGGASGQDIVLLAKAVARSVDEKFGITIQPEVNII